MTPNAVGRLHIVKRRIGAVQQREQLSQLRHISNRRSCGLAHTPRLRDTHRSPGPAGSHGGDKSKHRTACALHSQSLGYDATCGRDETSASNQRQPEAEVDHPWPERRRAAVSERGRSRRRAVPRLESPRRGERYFRSVEDHEAGRAANAFAFMAAAVTNGLEKQGLSRLVLDALIQRSSAAGLEHVVAPLRPSWKKRYPRVPMSEYLTWTRDDGLSPDPWIRTHQRMGAQILKPAPNSMVISASVAEWEKCAGMLFPASGSYVVPGALNLLEVDREHDWAIYREENLWVQHRRDPPPWRRPGCLVSNRDIEGPGLVL